VTPQQLIDNYPVLHHMAQAGSWSAIAEIGLRTTEQLVYDSVDSADLRNEILLDQRREAYLLNHPTVGHITVRDQQPLKLHNLLPKLSGISFEEFLKSLNDRVFLWARPERLDRLLGARLYREHEHDVLVVDTAALLHVAGDRVRLAGMNTGAAIFPNTPVRTPNTFTTVAGFPFDERAAAGKGLVDNVVEVCVLDGVDDVVPAVIRVERRRGANVLRTLYEA